MARLQAFAKQAKKPKFAVRHHNICKVCGRPRGYYRKFQLCRICLRKYALAGDIPGVTKSSW
jgi:small subunit ribosomal protein S14